MEIVASDIRRDFLPKLTWSQSQKIIPALKSPQTPSFHLSPKLHPSQNKAKKTSSKESQYSQKKNWLIKKLVESSGKHEANIQQRIWQRRQKERSDKVRAFFENELLRENMKDNEKELKSLKECFTPLNIKFGSSGQLPTVKKLKTEEKKQNKNQPVYQHNRFKTFSHYVSDQTRTLYSPKTSFVNYYVYPMNPPQVVLHSQQQIYDTYDAKRPKETESSMERVMIRIPKPCSVKSNSFRSSSYHSGSPNKISFVDFQGRCSSQRSFKLENIKARVETNPIETNVTEPSPINAPAQQFKFKSETNPPQQERKATRQSAVVLQKVKSQQIRPTQETNIRAYSQKPSSSPERKLRSMDGFESSLLKYSSTQRQLRTITANDLKDSGGKDKRKVISLKANYVKIIHRKSRSMAPKVKQEKTNEMVAGNAEFQTPTPYKSKKGPSKNVNKGSSSALKTEIPQSKNRPSKIRKGKGIGKKN